MGSSLFETNSLIDALMAEDDGVKLNSPFPVEFQRKNQLEKYRNLLKFNDLLKRLSLGIQAVEDNFDDPSFSTFIAQLEAFIDSRSDQAISQEMKRKLLELSKDKYHEQSYSEASAIYTVLILTDILNSLYWYCLGITEQAQNHYDEANQAYELAFDLDPTNFHSLVFSAECLIEQDNYQEAEEKLNVIDEQFKSELDQTNDFRDLYLTLRQVITDHSPV